MAFLLCLLRLRRRVHVKVPTKIYGMAFSRKFICDNLGGENISKVGNDPTSWRNLPFFVEIFSHRNFSKNSKIVKV